MPKMTLKQAMPKLQEMCHKHTTLMWYARSYPEGHPEWDKCDPKVMLGAFESQANVERDYPVEVAELQDDDTNWHHGFNSGVVAAIRYMWDLMENGEEYADENFPCLDT